MIGYVGTTGRSTGRICTTRSCVKAKQINPMGVKLPTGRNLTGKDLAAFQAEMARVSAAFACRRRLASSPMSRSRFRPPDAAP